MSANLTAKAYMMTVEVASASLSHLLPEVARADHDTLLREVFFHQSWAALDQQQLSLADDRGDAAFDFILGSTQVVDTANVLRRAAAGEPFVFCTFHYGSYRLLAGVLASRGVDFSLVIDQSTIKSQAEKFTALYQAFRSRRQTEVHMEILDAEDPRVGLQAIRRVKRGGSLVLYIDGNTGTGGVRRRDEKLIEIEFLGQGLFARQGVAFLSHVTGAHLVPVVCKRTGWLRRTMQFYPAIDPTGTEREVFCRETTQELYALLADHLRTAPEQWEGWLYVHKYLNTERLRARYPAPARREEVPLSEEDVLVLNRDRYVPLYVHGHPVLMDRATYDAEQVSRELSDVLNAFGEPARLADVARRLGADVVSRTVVQDLLRRSVLVHAAAASATEAAENGEGFAHG
ncbi:MAG UNVERIFIED_CONTAM: hypothetical protein LOD86_08165 [Thermobifida fusca]